MRRLRSRTRGKKTTIRVKRNWNEGGKLFKRCNVKSAKNGKDENAPSKKGEKLFDWNKNESDKLS